VLGALLLTIGPMLASLYLSFTDYNLFTTPNWVGLDNYRKLFTDDPRFLGAIWVTVKYVLISTPLKLVAALAVALLLNQVGSGSGLYRSAFYAPSLLGASVAVALVWRVIFDNNGVVDQAFGVQLGEALQVDAAPLARRLPRREPDRVVLGVDPAAQAVDPAEAQRLVHGLRPGDARLPGRHPPEAHHQLVVPGVVRREPLPPRRLGGEEAWLHCARPRRPPSRTHRKNLQLALANACRLVVRGSRVARSRFQPLFTPA